MTSRKVLDPTKLDVAALAADGATLRGDWPAVELGRWQAMQSPPSDVASGAVHWRVRGELRRAVGLAPQTWLHVSASSCAWAICQRCLQPFEQPIEVERSLRFVADEAQAATLDAESEDDVLALQPAIDLRTLVEDELLLAWPIVPRHAACTAPAHGAGEAGAERENPFAALATLKLRPPVN
jgi:uncharacterized protein